MSFIGMQGGADRGKEPEEGNGFTGTRNGERLSHFWNASSFCLSSPRLVDSMVDFNAAGHGAGLLLCETTAKCGDFNPTMP